MIGEAQTIEQPSDILPLELDRTRLGNLLEVAWRSKAGCSGA